MSKKRQKPSEAEAVAIMLSAFEAVPRLQIYLNLESNSVLGLIGLLQLATRHPALSERLRQFAEETARALQGAIVNATGSKRLDDLIEYGYDPDHDIEQIQDAPPINLREGDMQDLEHILSQLGPPGHAGGDEVEVPPAAAQACDCPGCRIRRGEIPPIGAEHKAAAQKYIDRLLDLPSERLLVELFKLGYAAGVDNARAES